jgi:hypothetical protein
LIPLVRLVLQSIKKYRVYKHKRKTSRKKTPSICIFVFLLVILVFRFLTVGLGLIRYTNRYLLFIFYSLIANQTLAPSRATSANNNPVFLKRASSKIVFQTNRTLLATSTKIDFIILIYALSLVFLVLIISFVSLYYRVGKILPVYCVFILYKINRNTQVVIIFLNKEIKGLFFVYTRLRIY